MSKQIQNYEVLYNLKIDNEFYTPAYGVEPLLEFMDKSKTYWLPFDTDDSEFVKVLEKKGYKYINSHIDTGQDFFEYEPEHWDALISNPPFQQKRKFFERALSFGKPFALLAPMTWFNDNAITKVFKEDEFQLLMFDKRIHFIKNGQVDKKITFATGYLCKDFLPSQIIFRELRR